MPDVFISYSRRDSEFAKRLTNRLVQTQHDIWIDWEDIPRASDWIQEIFAGIEGSENFIFIVSRHSLTSEICNYEVKHALDQNKRIIPLIREDIFGQPEKEIAGEWYNKAWEQTARDNWTTLKHLNWIFFNDDAKFEDEFAALIVALEQDLPYIKLHTRLLVRAKDWDSGGRNPSLLLTGDEITEAENWVAHPPSNDTKINPPSTDLHRTYITESRHAENERKRIEAERLAQIAILGKRTRQFRLASGVLALLIVLATVVMVFAVTGARQEVADAQATLTPVEETLVAVNQQVMIATVAQGEAEEQAELARTEVYFSGETLTPIPPTLTQAAETVADAEIQREISSVYGNALLDIHYGRSDGSLLVRRLLGRYSYQPYAWIISGVINGVNERYEFAIDDLTRAIELDPNNVDAYVVRGNIYYLLGEHELLIADYTHAIEINPNSAQVYYGRGFSYSLLSEYELAITDFTLGLELNPGYTTAYYYRGNAYSNLEDYESAIADYTQAIELDPDYASAYYGRGSAYYNLEDYESAIVDYTQAIELDPDYASAYYGQGNAYYSLEDYDNAINNYVQTILIDPNYVNAYYGQGSAYYNLENYDNAIYNYSQVVTLDSDYVSAYNNRGNAYYNLEDYETAIADYTRAIELDPDYAVAYYNRANAYYNLENYETAVSDYTRAIELDPDYAVAYINQGNTYFDLEDYNNATADYSQAIVLDPDNVDIYHRRGNAYYILEDYDNAIADFTQTIMLNSEYTIAYHNRGNGYYALGNYESAITDYTRAISGDPDNPSAYFYRGWAYFNLLSDQQSETPNEDLRQTLADWEQARLLGYELSQNTLDQILQIEAQLEQETSEQNEIDD